MLRQAIIIPARALRSSTQSLVQRPLTRPQNFLVPAAVRRIQPAAARWYTDAPKETHKGEAKEGDVEAPEAAEAVPVAEAAPASEAPEAAQPAEDPAMAELKKKFEAKNIEAIEWRDKCLRTIADFRNLQERTVREVKKAREFAIQNFAKDLLDSVDNLDRALSMVPEAKLTAEEKSEDLQDLVNLCDGLKMTDSIMQNTLKKHGLERFDPLGETFNPNEHEAVFQQPFEDKENGTVAFVQQKGFKLNDRVLRAAKVGVVRNPPPA